jgi:hypothetical protein
MVWRVGRDVAAKLADGFEECSLLRALRHRLQVHLQIRDLLERFVDIAMPQRPFEAVQLVLDIDWACGLSRRWQAFCQSLNLSESLNLSHIWTHPGLQGQVRVTARRITTARIYTACYMEGMYAPRP